MEQYPKPLFRSERYATVGGVCAGLALSRGYSITLVRIAALFLLSFAGIGIALYLAFWILLPPSSEARVEEPLTLPNDLLLRRREESMIAGVCASLARALHVDVTLVRVIYFVLVVLGGVSLMPYIYAWIVIPRNDFKF